MFERIIFVSHTLSISFSFDPEDLLKRSQLPRLHIISYIFLSFIIFELGLIIKI